LKARKKILISAYAVSPYRGSECAVGWEITKRLGKYFDVTVIMCSQTPSGDIYFEEIQKYIKENGPIENVGFVGIPMPASSRIFTWLHDIGFWPAYYWGYNIWQRAAFKRARELHIQSNFDLAFQLNMIGFREPGYLWKLDIPFIWGPVGGFHCIPFQFIRQFKGKDFIFQVLKNVINKLQTKFLLRPRKAARKAELVWCVDYASLNIVSKWNPKSELLQETGLNISANSYSKITKSFNGKRSLNLVWSGMVTPGKALDILIDTLILIKELDFKLVVLGDGQLLPKLKARAEQIKEKIIWKGWLPKEKAIQNVKNADLLIHTSLKDATSNVILEAIGLGIPVVCHDICGMGIVVNELNGFKIPYKNHATSVEYISDLLKSILHNPNILSDRNKSIIETINSLSWDTKVNYIAQKISSIINKK